MILPLRVDRLAARTELDELDELAQARAESPEQRLELALELADLSRELAEAAAAAWTRSPAYDLADKAARYVSPLRAACTARK
jgi:hypothetical protein